MKEIAVKTFAKINLSLDVIGKREDGYHNLKMVMQSVDLADTVRIRQKEAPGISLECNLPYLPTGETNLAVKAVRRLMDTGFDPGGLHIGIEKRIPVSAGLAGGSADAAGILTGLNKLFGLGLPAERLACLGLSLGSDVPYCLTGGTVLVEGIGEKLTPLPPLADCHIVIAKPAFGVSTGEVFSRLSMKCVRERPDTDGILEALSRKDFGGVARRVYNVLEGITAREHKIIGEIKRELTEQGAAGTSMSGSGPSVFGLFGSGERAEKAAARLRAVVREVYLCRPCSCGCEVVE